MGEKTLGSFESSSARRELESPPQLSSTCHLLDGLSKSIMTAPPARGSASGSVDRMRIGKPEAPATVMRKAILFED
jgi:hypothetical protein